MSAASPAGHMYGEPMPRLALETVDLAAVATHLHAQRVALYPAAIERGALGEAEAETGIRIMAAIADDWRRKLAVLPPPADPGATQAEKIETLAAAAARAAQLHVRKPTAEQDDYAECVACLLWWQQPNDFDLATEPGTTSRLDFYVAFNLQIRAERHARAAA